MRIENWEPIVKVGGEGGSLTLQGRILDGEWEFRMAVVEIFEEDWDDDPIDEDEDSDQLIDVSDSESQLRDGVVEGDAGDWGQGHVIQVEPMEPSIVRGWEDAAEWMGNRGFYRLYPTVVHEDFASSVWRFVLQWAKKIQPDLLEQWLDVCFRNDTEGAEVAELALWLKLSRSTVVLTGAGMSTESGVPDFRSSQGLWKSRDPRKLASVEALSENYDDFHDFYKGRIEGLDGCKPHVGHLILAEWERQGLVENLITQNVDRFHQEAGSQRVHELHGNIRTIRCQDCGSEANLRDFLEGESCTKCGGHLRPNVVLFGEMLPEDAWAHAVEAMQKADLVLVIGTSLEVYPANRLPQLSRGRVVLINKDSTGSDEICDLIIHEMAGRVLQKANEYLKLSN